MNARLLNIRRNRLADALILLIEAGKQKAAPGVSLTTDPDAATEARKSARQRQHTMLHRTGQKTEVVR